MRGATRSNNALLRENKNFNPRAPCGARQLSNARYIPDNTFQSTRPVRGATIWCCLMRELQVISIHAPRAGRDFLFSFVFSNLYDFNPRAPCGARLPIFPGNTITPIFQSTRPVRGATSLSSSRSSSLFYFNPRAPCGARHPCCYPFNIILFISIHAPRAGRDSADRLLSTNTALFQSTRPVRGATKGYTEFFKLQRFQSTRPVRGATEIGQ